MATTIHALAYKVSMDTSQFTKGAVATRGELREGAKLTDKYRTSMERAEIELKRLATLHQKGAISTATYRKEVDRLDREFKTLEKSSGKVSKTMTTLTSLKFVAGSALAFIGAGKLAHGITNSIREMDALIKQSRRIGVETEDLISLSYAAALTTTMTQEQVGRALQEMQKRIGEASQGTGEAVKAFDLLGISLDEAVNRSSIDNVREIVKQYGNLRNEQQQLFVADKIFAEAGVEMTTLLSLGVEEYDRLLERANELGLTWNKGINKEIENANDEMTKFSASMSGMWNEFVITTLPAVQALAVAVNQITQDARNVRTGTESSGPISTSLSLARRVAVGTAIALPQAAGDFRRITGKALAGTAAVGAITQAGGVPSAAALQAAQLSELRAIRSNQENNNNRADANLQQFP